MQPDELVFVGEDPERPIAPFAAGEEPVRAEPVGIAGVVDGEAHSVEADEPIERGQPDISGAALEDVGDGVDGKPVPHGPRLVHQRGWSVCERLPGLRVAVGGIEKHAYDHKGAQGNGAGHRVRSVASGQRRLFSGQPPGHTRVRGGAPDVGGASARRRDAMARVRARHQVPRKRERGRAARVSNHRRDATAAEARYCG